MRSGDIERVLLLLLVSTVWVLHAQGMCPAGTCQNGGTCVDIGPPVWCVCAQGYGGDLCEAELVCAEGWYPESGGVCSPCPRGTYQPTAGRATSCLPCPMDKHGYPGTTREQGATNRTHCVFEPMLRWFYPSYGPVAGGTLVRIGLAHLELNTIPLSASVADTDCRLVAVSDNTTHLDCLTTNVTNVTSGAVTVRLNDSTTLVTNDSFSYRRDPVVSGVSELKTFISGGLVITIYGRYLDSIAEPEMQVVRFIRGSSRVFVSPCQMVSGVVMRCPTPNLSDGLKHHLFSQSPPSHQRPARSVAEPRGPDALLSRAGRDVQKAVVFNDEDTRFYVGVGLDGVEQFGNLSEALPSVGQLLVYPDPVYHPFSGPRQVRTFWPHTDHFLHIQGEYLNYASDVDDVTVTVGIDVCNVTLLATNQLSCRPPREQPAVELTGYGPDNLPRVTVYVGTLTYVIGYLKYSKPAAINELALAVTLAILSVIAIVVAIVIYRFLQRRKGFWEKDSRLHISAAVQSNIYYTLNGAAGREVNTSRSNSNTSDVPLIGQQLVVVRPMSMTVSAPGTPDLLSVTPLGEGAFNWGVGNGAVQGGPRLCNLATDIDSDLRAALQTCETPSNRLVLNEVIGQGYFGTVYKGYLLDENIQHPVRVAVKTLHDQQCGKEEVTSFLREAVVMKDFSHTNVLSLLGVALRANKPYVILTYMQHGDLKSYIRDPIRSLKVRELLEFGIQVAAGMDYLARQKFVHRDLATRNCMINDVLVVKIADFGLSRDIYSSDYYKMEDKRKPLPVKWMAIESLTDGMFTTKSDVWSFGVLLWELLTRGCTPYPDVDSFNIKTYLLSGRRLSRPAHAPQQVYEIMERCWWRHPVERLSFEELHQLLDVIIVTKNTERDQAYLRPVDI